MVAAVNTERGIVIIDSGMSPTLSAKYRTIIEKESGRSDFKYVINTHHHDDHINGNQVFKEAEIIAHQNAAKRMKEDYENNKAYLKQRRERNERMNQLTETLEKDSDQYKSIRAWVYPFQKMLDDYKTVFQLILPSLTFTENLTLDMDDLKIEVVYFGPGFHTDNDIIVSIPEENIVFTGDLLRRRDQYSDLESKSDFDPWISSLDKILRRNNDVKNVVAYHEGVLPGAVLSDFHNSLINMRDDQRQKVSAVDSLRSMISASGLQEAVNKFESQFLNSRNKEYFIWEADLISLAKEYQEKEKYDEAQIILKMCEKIFPNSTTVLYRQGAFFMEAGKTKHAIEVYKKLLRIGPISIFLVDRIYQLENSK